MTYIPQHFRVSDEPTLQEFMRTYDFATIVSSSPDRLVASHVPVLVRPSGATLVIVGHMARANHHWRLMDGATPALAVELILLSNRELAEKDLAGKHVIRKEIKVSV